MPVVTIPFSGVCLAGAELTLCSKRITRPYVVIGLTAHFPLGCERLLALSFFASEDPSTPATGKPSGSNILGELAQDAALAGDNNTVYCSANWTISTRGSWLKIYSVNSDGFDHTVDAQISIELTEEET